MPFTLNNLPESAIEKESELLALAAGLTRADIVKGTVVRFTEASDAITTNRAGIALRGESTK